MRSKQDFAKMLRHRMPVEEKILWESLKGNQILGQHFRRQHVLLGYIADFCCLKAKLVVEVDGDYHLAEKQIHYDAQRDRAMESKGFKVLRFSNDNVNNNLMLVVAIIEDELRRRIDSKPLKKKSKTGGTRVVMS